MTTQSDDGRRLSRPTRPLSSIAATHLRIHQRLRAVPPRRVGAITLALLVGIATWSVVNEARTSQSRWGDVLAVVVAVSDIDPGDELTAANTELRALPLALLPRNALTEDRLDRRARSAIGVGQIIVDSQVMLDRHGLDPERHSITLPQPLAPPALIGGDTVDLIAVRAAPDGALARAIATALVVEVDENGITITLDRAMTGRVFEALASGSVEFARRPPQR